MSTLNARRAPMTSRTDGKPDRADAYQQVTDLIIGHLEKGMVPWRCPWNREVGRPRNFHTGKPYQGVNVMLLGCRFAASPWWMTYRQALERGGQVRKGEHGAMVTKFGTFDLKENSPRPNEDGKQRQGMFLRTFTVFNSNQIDGIPFPEISQGAELSPDERNELADNIVKSMPQIPVVREGSGSKACYSPVLDQIEMPAFSRFESGAGYYGTLFHELTHSTGHPSRLNRESLTNHDGFGGKVYGQEELVAEMGSAFVGLEADLVSDRHEQSAAYLQGWLGVLKVKDHRRWIVQAASQASRAADFILGRSQDDGELQPLPTN